MFLVVWTTKIAEDEYEDHWIAADTYAIAAETYEETRRLDDTYSITICQPIKSTEAHFTEEPNDA